MSDDSHPERRRITRLERAIPIRIVGRMADGTSWTEEAATTSISGRGASFCLERPCFKGQVLELWLDLPPELREFDRDALEYHVYGIVRNAIEGPGACRLGVMFYGRHPPSGFERTPGAAFLLPQDLPAHEVRLRDASRADRRSRQRQGEDPLGRRRHPRFDVLVEFVLQRIDEWDIVLYDERSVTENLSAGGARLKAAARFAPGEIILLRESGGAFVTRGEVRNFYVGPDGVRRVNVRFLDGSPLHLARGVDVGRETPQR